MDTWLAAASAVLLRINGQETAAIPSSPSPLSEAGRNALQFCHTVGCESAKGVAAAKQASGICRQASAFHKCDSYQIFSGDDANADAAPTDLGKAIHRRFAALGGVDLKIPPRGPIRAPRIR
jgi:hypothetical protein